MKRTLLGLRGEKMKILLVNKFLYPRGGAESYMLGIGKKLEQLGHEVQYFGMFDEKNTVKNEIGEYTGNMDFHTSSLKKLAYPFKIIYSFEAKKKLGRVLDAFKPDVVHLNNINFQLTPSIIDETKKHGIPVVWTLHDYQLICPAHLLYNVQRNEICEKCVARGKTPCIKNRCIHGSLAKSIIGVAEWRFYRIKKTYKKVDVFISPSKFLYSKLCSDSPELFEGKTEVMHNYVTERKLPEKAKSNFDFPYVVFAGRLSKEKGTDILAKTAKLLPDVKFVVMGDGPERAAFDNIENVVATGFVSGVELDENIAFAKALLLPSVCFENCPMSILEAEMFSVPCVTMNMGGMAELVEDGKTGLLSERADAESFAAAVRDILSDEKRLEAMRENCKEKSGQNLTLDTYCKRLLEIYKTAGEKQCRK